MTDSEPKEVTPFKAVTGAGEELPSLAGFSGQVTVQFSNGDRYDGPMIDGVR
jgi:hypothetical protein